MVDPNIGKIVGQYTFIKKIQTCKIGAIYLARSTDIPTFHVAIKMIPKSTLPEDIKYYEGEAGLMKIMKTLKHPNLLEGITQCESKQNNYYFVYEHCEGNSLVELSKANIAYQEAIGYIKDICSGYYYLHIMGFMHRDINPSHILFKKGDGKYIAKIGDYGSVKNMGPKIIDELASSRIGMATYMSPELLNGGSYTYKTDMFSIGLIAYELIYKKPAFNFTSEVALFNEYKNGNITFNINIPPACNDFILRLLQFDPEKRMSIEECIAHSLIK